MLLKNSAGQVRFYSTNRQSPLVPFSEALMKGLAPDGGLYMPERISRLRESSLRNLMQLTYPELAARILYPYVSSEVPEDDLLAIASDSYDFDIPVERVDDNLYILRLDRGPTASFKDFAARMMARLMQYFIRSSGRRLLILVATSGDTGSAIASAFHGLPGAEVVILFPRNEVSENQRRQMTTLGGNIRTLSVDCKFDDCQRLVKKAFGDPELEGMGLSSANSINIGRLLPQSVYYFYAWLSLAGKSSQQTSFAIPSGNFGNMMGGMIATRMGLPAGRFLIAVNGNDEFPRYLETGRYKPVVPSVNCISNAMNVGHPSNLARLVDLYGGNMNETGTIVKEPDMKSMRRDIYSLSVSDEMTVETIKSYYSKFGILIEPHGAVSLTAVDRYRRETAMRGAKPGLIIAVETAHPAKFPEVVGAATGMLPPVPEPLKGLDEKREVFIETDGRYETLRDFLKSIK
ncbi:MAG: threonine synthase [Bacteroidales bacterium]|jgi:threonine synthase|nr:threonine synthase [Bacteroidales bacterium]